MELDSTVLIRVMGEVAMGNTQLPEGFLCRGELVGISESLSHWCSGFLDSALDLLIS